MKKSLYLFGGLIILAVAADLSDKGSALVRVVQAALTHRAGEPLPESLGLVIYTGVHMLAFALGLALTCIGILRHSDQHSMTGGGRILHAAGGLGVIVSAAMCGWVVYTVRGEFLLGLEQGFQKDGPLPPGLLSAIELAPERMRRSFMILGAAGGLFSLAAVAGLKFWPPRPATEGQVFLRRGLQVAAVVVAVALAVAVVQLLPRAEAIRLWLEPAEAAPDPIDVAETLLEILNRSLVAFGLLAFLGWVQMLAAAQAPGLGDAELLEDRYDDEGDENGGYDDEGYDGGNYDDGESVGEADDNHPRGTAEEVE